MRGLQGLRGLRGLQKLQGEAAGRGCRQGLQAGAAGRGCRGRVGLQGCSTHPISSAPPAQSDVPSQTCLPCTHVPSGQNQPGVSSAEVVHWKPPEVPWYAVRTARPRLVHACPVRTVRGASGQAALRLWNQRHAGGPGDGGPGDGGPGAWSRLSTGSHSPSRRSRRCSWPRRRTRLVRVRVRVRGRVRGRATLQSAHRARVGTL